LPKPGESIGVMPFGPFVRLKPPRLSPLRATCGRISPKPSVTVEQARVADHDVQADGHDRVHAHDHGGLDCRESAEEMHRRQAAVVERIGDRDDNDDRRDNEPPRPPELLRHVWLRVLHGEEERD